MGYNQMMVETGVIWRFTWDAGQLSLSSLFDLKASPPYVNSLPGFSDRVTRLLNGGSKLPKISIPRRRKWKLPVNLMYMPE
jgi:hypothetical protein